MNNSFTLYFHILQSNRRDPSRLIHDDITVSSVFTYRVNLRKRCIPSSQTIISPSVLPSGNPLLSFITFSVINARYIVLQIQLCSLFPFSHRSFFCCLLTLISSFPLISYVSFQPRKTFQEEDFQSKRISKLEEAIKTNERRDKYLHNDVTLIRQ